MGGADTVATAYSLAQAIRRIERELFGGSRDYVIVTGMQSVDGDTAQVPPQLAEDLGIDQVAYAQDVHTEPVLTFRRIGAAGHRGRGPRGASRSWSPSPPARTRSTRLPRRPCRAQRRRSTPGARPTSGAKPDRVGIKGSRTTVYRIFSPSEDRAKHVRDGQRRLPTS